MADKIEPSMRTRRKRLRVLSVQSRSCIMHNQIAQLVGRISGRQHRSKTVSVIKIVIPRRVIRANLDIMRSTRMARLPQ